MRRYTIEIITVTEENAPVPKFKEQVKRPHIGQAGFVLYYTSQCPFTAKYVPPIEELAKNRKVLFESIHLETAEEAKKAPAAVTTYS